MDFRGGFRGVALVTMVLAVAGCGGGSTSGGPSFQELGQRFVQLDDAALAQPSTTDMPVSGTAQYFGRGGFVTATSPDDINSIVFGRVALTADFSNSQVSGSMTDFRDQTNSRVPGTLNVTSGPIVGNTVPDVQVRGNVRLDGVSTSLDMAGDGEFRGPRARFFRAEFEGTATGGGQTRLAGGELVVREPQQ